MPSVPARQMKCTEASFKRLCDSYITFIVLTNVQHIQNVQTEDTYSKLLKTNFATNVQGTCWWLRAVFEETYHSNANYADDYLFPGDVAFNV